LSVADLGLEDRLLFTEGDALAKCTIEELYDEVGGEGRVDLLWLDFGDGDRLDEILITKGYWNLIDPNGGLLLVHSTVTNNASRQWLARMKQLAICGNNDYGPFELISLMEPHKMRKNSVSIFRRKGASVSEPYNEPLFTAFS
jgi:hypothetical protein